MSYRPEDILPDDKDYVETKEGQKIRKGSVAATLANAKIIESADASLQEKAEALDAIRALAPTLIAFDLMRFMQWKNPIIQAVFDEVK